MTSILLIILAAFGGSATTAAAMGLLGSKSRQKRLGSSSNALLSAHDIPRPELLLANMLAMRIATLHPTENIDRIDLVLDGCTVLLRFGEVRASAHKSFWREEVLLDDPKTIMSVYYAAIKKPSGDIVECKFNDEEKQILTVQALALETRGQIAKLERTEQASSLASLDALNALLAPVEEKVPLS